MPRVLLQASQLGALEGERLSRQLASDIRLNSDNRLEDYLRGFGKRARRCKVPVAFSIAKQMIAMVGREPLDEVWETVVGRHQPVVVLRHSE